MRTRLGQYLVMTGVLSEERLGEALSVQATSGEPLGAILQARGWITQAQLAQTLAAQLEMPFVDAPNAAPDPEALHTLPLDVATRLGVLPLAWDADVLQVAMADPLDIDVLEELESQVGVTVEPVVAEAGPLATAIQTHYADDLRRCDALETARAQLRHRAEALRDEGHTPRLVVCTAATPAIGVTHLVVSLAAAAAAQGQRVVVVDASVDVITGPAPTAWTDHALCTDLVHADLSNGEVKWGATPHGIHVIGGATGVPLRSATPEERIVGAANLLELGADHDLIVCDLGCAPLDGAVEWWLAADVTLLLTAAQDIVGAYELLRGAAVDRWQRYPADRDAQPLDLGIVVTFADAGPAGREVFDHLDSAVERHVNAAAPSLAGQLRLGLLGLLPADRDAADAAERSNGPVVRCAPGTRFAQGAEDITQAVLERLRRPPDDALPLGELVALAGTTRDRRR